MKIGFLKQKQTNISGKKDTFGSSKTFQTTFTNF